MTDSSPPSGSSPGSTPDSSSGRPPRRPRYRGTHPRRFDEKYKELNPERFPGEVAKAVARGSTPAGSHLPVMLDEVLAALRPRPGDVYLDATLGYGGHAEAVAQRIAPGGRLVGMDRDADELPRAAERLRRRGLVVAVRHGSYSGAAKALRDEGIDGADLVLADLGCSSMQLDRPDRGFSFKNDGPLDMRMDRSRPGTAAQWLATASREDIETAIRDLGDEEDADDIAREIVRRRESARPLDHTADLVSAVLAAKEIPGEKFVRDSAFTAHPAARTFQAVRMVVNRETEHLSQFLRDLPWIVRPGGRAAILTFHSGEESLVRAAFEQGAEQGLWMSPLAEPLVPSSDERRRNPRSRSARLHVGIRLDAPPAG
ncbi:MAG: 16S rRNA (cytosine(1402)-N(4))-methyltransferase RsmH [Planctomycetes bacterium]|nr:16S rRNA (cytosine(1402)-N(4))-methyltransferase RsmH [Planctomycetota bacterium]